jgi:hypothetical protein
MEILNSTPSHLALRRPADREASDKKWSFVMAGAIAILVGAVGAAPVQAGEMTFAEVAIAEAFVVAISAGLIGVTLWLDLKAAEVLCIFDRDAGQITVDRLLRGRRFKRKTLPLACYQETITDPGGPDTYRLQLRIRGSRLGLVGRKRQQRETGHLTHQPQLPLSRRDQQRHAKLRP